MQYVTDQYHLITSVHRLQNLFRFLLLVGNSFNAHKIHKNIFKIDITL